MAAGRKGLRTLGALALAFAALPAAAADKPLTIQQKRETVFEKVQNQSDRPFITEYGAYSTVVRNSFEWYYGGLHTSVKTYSITSSFRDSPLRLLELEYVAPGTFLSIRDAQADGLGPNDDLALQRTYVDGSVATLLLRYLGDNTADVVLYVRNDEADKTSYNIHFSTDSLNTFARWRLRKPLNAAVTLGTRTYEQMLDDVLANRRPSLPIAELDALCSDLEPYLTKRFDDGAARSLAGLARSYEKTILEKVKE